MYPPFCYMMGTDDLESSQSEPELRVSLIDRLSALTRSALVMASTFLNCACTGGGGPIRKIFVVGTGIGCEAQRTMHSSSASRPVHQSQ